MTIITRFARHFLLAVLLAVAPAFAVGLNDSGQDDCYDDSAINATGVEADGGTHPRQDCRFGRDAAAKAGVLYKIGAGAKGFDFTKIANDGTSLAAGAALGANPTDWACTQDNVTGLIWEVKTIAGLHFKDHTYTWYNSDAATNGGVAGTSSGGTCQTAGRCDTEKFVADVNSAALCTYTDWRLTSRRELLTLAHKGVNSPTIDTAYFPNTNSHYYWTSASWAAGPSTAWNVVFSTGNVNADNKFSGHDVRLVRGGQF